MIHPDDVTAWIAQVRQRPDAAPDIIATLAARLIELDEQNEALRDELVRLSRSRESAAGDDRMAALARRVQLLERQLERGEKAHPADETRTLLVFTLDGRGARLPVPDHEAWQSRDDYKLVASHLRPRHLLIAAEQDDLLFFSDKGRVARLRVSAVNPAQAPIDYLSLVPGLVLELDESVGVVTRFPTTFERLTLVTRKGYVRSFRRAEVDSLLERGLSLHSSPIEGDYPAFALIGDGESELFIATRSGKGVRFPERVVEVQAQPGINLDRGDVVAGAAIVNDEMTLVLVTSDGAAARREMTGFGAHATAGNRAKLFARRGGVIAVAPVTSGDVLWMLTAAGKLHVVPAKAIPSGPGASSGKFVVKLDEDQAIALTVNKGA